MQTLFYVQSAGFHFSNTALNKLEHRATKVCYLTNVRGLTNMSFRRTLMICLDLNNLWFFFFQSGYQFVWSLKKNEIEDNYSDPILSPCGEPMWPGGWKATCVQDILGLMPTGEFCWTLFHLSFLIFYYLCSALEQNALKDTPEIPQVNMVMPRSCTLIQQRFWFTVRLSFF